MEWEYTEIPKKLIEKTAKIWGVSSFLATLLLKKGFTQEQCVKDFLHPSFNNLENPFDFEMMEMVVKKIIDLKMRNEKIFIYGDYDVDGITAATFLVLVFRELDMNIDYYIPNRLEEGYGLNSLTIDYVHQKGGKLIITVDTGVNSSFDINYAKSLGIDIIVTDHHKTIKSEIDSSILYINPKLSSKYDFKYLAGAGVAFKVAQALFLTLNEDMEKLYKFLDIIMIGTVGDVVPMIGENRVLISKGLSVMKKTNVKGLLYLKRYLKLYEKDISTTDISYFVSPLINSLGRLGNSKLAAEFFIKTDDFEIYNIIEEMKNSNKQRRELERNIFNSATQIIQNEMKQEKNLKCIFLSSKKWHPGVIGVVASRLSMKYNIPVVMISLKNGVAKASCRSVKNINIFDILSSMKDRLVRFGGHDLAAGFIAKEEELPIIKSILIENINFYDFVPQENKTFLIDMKLNIDSITNDIINDLNRLAPFGVDNRHPYFLCEKVLILNKNFFGVDNRHFNGMIRKDKKTYMMIAFDLSSKLFDKKENTLYDIIYYPEIIISKGKKCYQLRLKDIKLSLI